VPAAEARPVETLSPQDREKVAAALSSGDLG